MKKLALTLRSRGAHFVFATGLMVAGLAGPAMAFVVDRQDLVTATDEQKLESALAKLGSHRFEVVFVDQVDGTPSNAAKKKFRELKLGEKDGVIVVAIGAKKVGVHVGEDFARRGVSDDVVSERIKADFLPFAKQGQYARGTATLAKGLVDAGANGTPTSGSRVSHSGRQSERSGGGFPWGLVLFVGAAGVGVWYFLKQKGGADLTKRLQALRGPQERIMSGSIKLAEIDSLTRFQEGEAKAAYEKLARSSNRTLTEARAFGERFDSAEAALKSKNNGEAEQLIAQMEREAVMLEAEVAAAMTALANLEDGEITAADIAGADLPERVRKASRELADQQADLRKLQERAQAIGYAVEARIEGHLKDALEALTVQPVDLKAALKSLAESENAMNRFKSDLADAEERHRIEEARRAEERREAAERAAMTAAIIASSNNSHHHHHHHDSGYSSSSSSSWDSGSSSSSDSDWGSSASDSWGSDSGGSSSDENW